VIEGIKAYVDGAEAGTAKNDVEAVVPLDACGQSGESRPYERHVKVTHEGVIVDIVVGGEVVETASFEHHELLDWDGG